MRKILLFVLSFLCILTATTQLSFFTKAAHAIDVTWGKDVSFSLPSIPLKDGGRTNSYLFVTASDQAISLDHNHFSVQLQVGLNGCLVRGSTQGADSLFTGIDGTKLSCTVTQNGSDNANITINGKFNTQALGIGNTSASYTVGALSEWNKLYPTIQINVKPADSSTNISVNAPTSAKWGEKKNMTINKIPNIAEKRTLVFTISSGNILYSYKIDVQNGSCTAKDYDNQVFSFASPVCSNGSATVGINFNAPKFPKPTLSSSSGPFGSSGLTYKTTYNLSFKEANGYFQPPLPLASKLDLTFDNNKPVLSLNPIPKYEKELFDIKVEGCPIGTSKIHIKITADNGANAEFDITSGNTMTGYKLSESFKKSTTTFVATCQPSNIASNEITTEIGQIGSGNERIVLPEKINANEAFQATLTNLNYESDDNCYYVKLLYQGNLVKKEDTNQCGGIDNGESTKSVEATAPEMEIDMPPLEAGKYTLQLFRTDRKTGTWDFPPFTEKNKDEKNDEVDFCVGVGENSQGESCTEEDLISPPAPPCITPEADGSCNRINTAFGEMNIDISTLSKTLFTLLLSISGGIILLVVIRSGYLLMFSQGNPERIKEAQDRLTSAFIGFLFLIFSLVILETIGVDILHIPGIGK